MKSPLWRQTRSDERESRAKTLPFNDTAELADEAANDTNRLVGERVIQ